MTTNSNDEIDLQKILILLIRFVRKKFWTLMISGLGGAVVIGGLSFLLPNVYMSKMILSSDILTQSYSDRITESLDKLIKEQNYTTLAARLEVSEEDAEKIKKIEIESIYDINKTEKKEESTTFVVTTEVTDNAILPKLQSGIISYLRNNEFVKIRVQQRITMFKAMIDKIGEEIRSLDSLRDRLFKGKPVYAQGTEMLLVDPTSIYSKIVDLNHQQINYINELEIVNSIQLVEGFTAFKKPARPHHGDASIAGFFVGIFLYLIVLGIKWVLKKSEPLHA